MRALLEELYPLPRSITGEGLRSSLAVVARGLPELETTEVRSGTAVFDWTVPPEWNVNSARLVSPTGEIVADFARHNLMLLNYSEPFHGRMTLEELQPHLHSIPEQPHAIPYKTSYYQRDWGFCLPHSERETLKDGEYLVEIDTDLSPGSLSYGQLVVQGEVEDEVLLSAHICHPSLANDNLSGVVVLVEFARALVRRRNHFTYRLLFAPGTIGTIAMLASTPEALQRIEHGLVLAGLGDSGPLSYKQTIHGTSFIDRAAAHVLAGLEGSTILRFDPSGYDERQYASPGIRLPVGRLGRTAPGTYPEYHTSLDNLSFVSDASLVEALHALEQIVEVIEEGGQRFMSMAPNAEPQLGKRGILSPEDSQSARSAMLWMLALADGHTSVFDVAERSGLPFATVLVARDSLSDAGLLVPVET